MSDWALVAARLVLYLDLGLLFGLPFFAVTVLRPSASAMPGAGRLGPPVVGLALAGALLSALHFLMLTAAMAGTDLAGVDYGLVSTLVSDSALGGALIARIVALIAAAGAGLAIAFGRRSGLFAATIAGGAALATLAWGGHAAATEGGAASLHLATDVVHLLAAGTWLSALFALLYMTVRADTAERLRSALRALQGFSAVGIGVVAALLASGSLSALLILGLPRPATLLAYPYGRLLAVKLALFLLMLMLAALNRSWLTPRLERAVAMAEPRAARAALRASLALESMAALVILGIVSRLGMLPPTGS